MKRSTSARNLTLSLDNDLAEFSTSSETVPASATAQLTWLMSMSAVYVRQCRTLLAARNLLGGGPLLLYRARNRSRERRDLSSGRPDLLDRGYRLCDRARSLVLGSAPAFDFTSRGMHGAA